MSRNHQTLDRDVYGPDFGAYCWSKVFSFSLTLYLSRSLSLSLFVYASLIVCRGGCLVVVLKLIGFFSFPIRKRLVGRVFGSFPAFRHGHAKGSGFVICDCFDLFYYLLQISTSHFHLLAFISFL